MVTQKLCLSEKNHFLKVDSDRDDYPISITGALTSGEILSPLYKRKSFRETAYTAQTSLS